MKRKKDCVLADESRYFNAIAIFICRLSLFCRRFYISISVLIARASLPHNIFRLLRDKRASYIRGMRCDYTENDRAVFSCGRRIFIDFHESETICTRDQAYHQRSGTYVHTYTLCEHAHSRSTCGARSLDICYNMRSRPTRAGCVNTHTHTHAHQPTYVPEHLRT